jgi:hypothetical protein
MLASALAAILVIWFLLSALNQINPISTRLGPYDPLGLLPRWTFFAPHPGIYDYHLLYRECDSSETQLGNIQMVEAAKHLIGPWVQVPDVCPGSTRVMWNPQRRVTKTITDIVAGLTMIRLAYPELGDGIQYTSYYWLLLHLIQRESRRAAQRRQFAVIQSHGFPPERTSAVFFISNFHIVGAAR